MTNEEQELFLQTFHTLEPKEQPVALSLFENVSSSFHHKADVKTKVVLPKSLRSFYTKDETNYERKRTDLYLQKLSKEEIVFIESATRGQAKSLIWHDLQVGRITASVAHDVLHTSLDKPSVSLILKICCKGQPLNVPAVKWGQDNESKALQYKNQLQTMHSNVHISKTGLMISQEHPFLGASADGIGSCDCHGNFLIEIKCPYTLREKKNVGECLGEKNFFLDNDLKLKNGHRYFT